MNDNLREQNHRKFHNQQCEHANILMLSLLWGYHLAIADITCENTYKTFSTFVAITCILQATKSWVGTKLVFNIWALRWQLVVHCSNISHNMYRAWNYTAFHLNLHFCFHYIVCCYHESEDILCFSCSILTLPMAENSAWWGNWKNRDHIAWVKTRGGRACREIDYKHVVEIYKSLCNTYV